VTAEGREGSPPRIGIIGAGFNGRAVARLGVQHGYDVMLSNGRDPATLGSVMIRCKIGTYAEAAGFGDVVLLTLPFASLETVPSSLLAGKIVIDAINAEDAGGHSSQRVAVHCKGAYVVKALNVIGEREIESSVRPSGAAGRMAIPIAGDADHAKQAVSAILNRFGFDVVDAGALSEGWRFAPNQPAFGVRLDQAALTAALAAAGG
jgi:predicted dinucleotide-binding enzyme